MTDEDYQKYYDRNWDALEMDEMEETYRMMVRSTFSIGNQIALRRRMIWTKEELEWEERVFDNNGVEKEDEINKYTPTSTANTPYPRCTITNHDIQGENVIQLSYEGILPLYFQREHVLKEKDMGISSYLKAVEHSYLLATNDALSLLSAAERPKSKNKAFLYVCHFYSDLKIRDLDNRNRSALINSARYGRLIDGDEWEKLSYMEEGYLDVAKKNHISMFISSRENGLKTVGYVNDLYQKGHHFRL